MKSWGLPLFVPILQSPSSSPGDLFTLDRIIPLLKTHSTLAEKQTPYHDIPQSGPCPPCLRPSPSINCVRPNNGSSGSTKDQVLIPGSCEYVHLLGKKNSAEVIKLRILRRESYPGLSRWPQWCNHNGPCKNMGGQRRWWDNGSRDQRKRNMKTLCCWLWRWS